MGVLVQEYLNITKNMKTCLRDWQPFCVMELAHR